MPTKRSIVAALAACPVLAGCRRTAESAADGPRSAHRGRRARDLQLPLTEPQSSGSASPPTWRAAAAAGTLPAAASNIPYSAVVYDTDGSTWTYVNTRRPDTYARDPITVNRITASSPC